MQHGDDSHPVVANPLACVRWHKVLNPAVTKGPWTAEEDKTVLEVVKLYGPQKWTKIASFLPGRIGKQCRERYHNHLSSE